MKHIKQKGFGIKCPCVDECGLLLQTAKLDDEQGIYTVYTSREEAEEVAKDLIYENGKNPEVVAVETIIK